MISRGVQAQSAIKGLTQRQSQLPLEKCNDPSGLTKRDLCYCINYGRIVTAGGGGFHYRGEGLLG